MSLALRIARRRFALAKPFRSASLSVVEREVAVVGLFEHDELVGVGETAPLPGYSVESLDDAVSALDGFDLPRLLDRIEAGDLDAASRATASLPASARCGIEVAALDRASARAAIPFADAIGRRAPRAASAPAVLVDAAMDLPSALSRVAGASTVKIKVGGDRERELALVASIRAHAPDVVIRLDANRSLDVVRDRAFLEALAAHRPAFVEEPFGDVRASLALESIPVALDESLRDLGDDDIASLLADGRVAALVLKPTTLSFLRCVHLAIRTLEVGRGAVVSHCFEGPVGFAALVALADVLPEDAPGLDAAYGPRDESVAPPRFGTSAHSASPRFGLGLVSEVGAWFA